MNKNSKPRNTRKDEGFYFTMRRNELRRMKPETREAFAEMGRLIVQALKDGWRPKP